MFDYEVYVALVLYECGGEVALLPLAASMGITTTHNLHNVQLQYNTRSRLTTQLLLLLCFWSSSQLPHLLILQNVILCSQYIPCAL